MSETTAPSAEKDAPILCSWCNETSDGDTVLAFIHAHANCPLPPGGSDA